MDFANAKETYESAKDKQRGARYGRKSRADVRVVKWGDDGYGIRMYNTVIVGFLPNGNVVLDHGGYSTVTTKKWINDILADLPISKDRYFQVIQKDHDWFLMTRTRVGERAWKPRFIPFQRHMVITKRGSIKRASKEM